MADKKISALTGATTPLAGTEVLPIVQGSATVKVSVADLTAGRAVAMAGGSFTDNITQNTAAKGVNFTANTPAAGMTSQLLNWYEEGTWTPVPTSLTVVGTPTYTGKYTRVGRQVFIYLTVRSTTSTASTANTTYFSGLPFVVGFGSTVSAVNNATITDLGIGLIDASSVIYTPSWTSGTNQTITLSGFYYV